MSCGVGRRSGSDPAWLWLWCRPAAVAPIQPTAWEPPLKKKKTLPVANEETEAQRISVISNP